jgi:hypothetical protein
MPDKTLWMGGHRFASPLLRRNNHMRRRGQPVFRLYKSERFSWGGAGPTFARRVRTRVSIKRRLHFSTHVPRNKLRHVPAAALIESVRLS